MKLLRALTLCTAVMRKETLWEVTSEHNVPTVLIFIDTFRAPLLTAEQTR